MAKAVAPELDTKGIKLNAKTGRYHFEIERIIDEDSREPFRRRGSGVTPEEAVQKRDEALAELAAIRAGKAEVQRKGVTVEDFAQECVESIWVEEIGERTVLGYDDILRNHVIPNIGGVRLHKLTYDHVAGINDKLKSKGLSVQTRKNVRNCISKLFSTAQRVGKVGKDLANPAPMLIIKTEDKRDEEGNVVTHKRTLTPLEVQALLAQVKGDRFEAAVMVGLYAGLRIGEVTGLTWANVHFDKRMLSVTQQRQYVRKKGTKTASPKTVAGTRKVPIADHFVIWLTDAKATSTGRYVVTKPNGAAVSSDQLTRWFKDLVTAAGLCGVRDEHGALLPDPTPHDLRHTFAHYMANGWPTKLDDDGRVVTRTASTPITQLAKMLGHSTITMTEEYYVDTTDDDLLHAIANVTDVSALKRAE